MAWYSLIEEKGSVFVCCQVLPPSLVVSSAVFWCVSPEKDWLIIHPWFWSENEKDCTFPCSPPRGYLARGHLLPMEPSIGGAQDAGPVEAVDAAPYSPANALRHHVQTKPFCQDHAGFDWFGGRADGRSSRGDVRAGARSRPVHQGESEREGTDEQEDSSERDKSLHQPWFARCGLLHMARPFHVWWYWLRERWFKKTDLLNT